MGRIRTIKPEFPQSESIGRLSRDARLLFIQLWTLADDEGRLRGLPRMLAGLLYPYDTDATQLMDGWLAELEREETIQRYRADSDSYIQITNWRSHQKIDKPGKSKLPAFEEGSRGFANDREGSRMVDDGSRTVDEGSRTKDQGEDQGKDHSPSPAAPVGVVVDPIESIYEEYPRKEGRRVALAAIEKAVERVQKGEGNIQLPEKRTAQAYLFRRVKIYAQSPAGRRQDKSRIPHPATWFNQSRYLDDEANWQITGETYGNSSSRSQSKTAGNFDEAREALRILAGEDVDDTRHSEAGECIEGHVALVRK